MFPSLIPVGLDRTGTDARSDWKIFDLFSYLFIFLANKVMRMGSFAYRATQFFENLGKKSNTKRKTSSLSSPTDTDYHLRDGIQEESSLSSSSIGLPAVSPSSETTSPVFEDGFRHSSAFSSPTSPEPPPLPSTPPPPIPSNVKQQGLQAEFLFFFLSGVASL